MTIQSKVPTDEYKKAWDRIFGKKKEDRKDFEYPPIPDEDNAFPYKNDQGH